MDDTNTLRTAAQAVVDAAKRTGYASLDAREAIQALSAILAQPEPALTSAAQVQPVTKKQCEHGARSEAMCSICSRR